MRVTIPSALFSVSAALLLAGCGGSSSNNVTCGAGTHDAGNGTCVVDNAIAIVNGSNSYWKCVDNGGGAEFLQIAAGSSTSGTGRYQFQASPVQSVYSFNWSEAIPTTDAMTVSFAGGANWNEIKNIVPNSLVNPTGFKADVVSNNNNGSISCTLASGTF